MKSVATYSQVTPDLFKREIVPQYRPALLKGFYENWPLVQAAKKSNQVLVDALKKFASKKPVYAVLTPAGDSGQLMYRDDMKGFNFRQLVVPFDALLDDMWNRSKDNLCDTLYMGSTPAEDCAPGLMMNHANPFVTSSVKPRLWMGNKSIIQTHFDVSDNIAVVAAGHRRFTFFPPDQIHNLYVGPIDVNPAGQPISMVSLLKPDFEKYPRYREAFAVSEIAELEPGDAVYIPSLWWHGVEGLDDFNLLVNYWWNNSAVGVESPFEALIHSVLTISNLPEKERAAWKVFFDHYIFQEKGHPLEHLPENIHGVLGKMNPELYHRVKMYLYSRMKVKGP